MVSSALMCILTATMLSGLLLFPKNTAPVNQQTAQTMKLNPDQCSALEFTCQQTGRMHRRHHGEWVHERDAGGIGSELIGERGAGVGASGGQAITVTGLHITEAGR